MASFALTNSLPSFVFPIVSVAVSVSVAGFVFVYVFPAPAPAPDGSPSFRPEVEPEKLLAKSRGGGGASPDKDDI